MTERAAEAPPQPSRRRLTAALGWAAGGLLAVSLFFPYWQARLFAPQYRQGLTATMYSWKLTGDIDEIDGLNHYIGMRKMGSLARLERAVAIPSVLGLALLCGFAFWRGPLWLRRAAAAAAVFFPVAFVADMAFWMSYASGHLDPAAPLKLKPFTIPVIGAGRVAQFHSHLMPQLGFYLAAAAMVLVLWALWLSRRESAPEAAPPGKPQAAALVAALLLLTRGAAAAPSLSELIAAASPGAVIDLPAGRYEAPVVIAKPLTVRGGGAAVVDGRGRGTLVTIKAPGVTLEGLALVDSGESMLYEDSAVRVEAPSAVIRGCRMSDVLFGVFLVHAPDALIEGNSMTGKPLPLGRRGDLLRSWNSDRVTVRGNDLEGGRDAVLWFSTGSVVEANTVRGGRYGLHFMYTNNAVVRGNLFERNSVGLYAMYSTGLLIESNRFRGQRGPSGAALGLKEGGSITVRGNSFVGNRQGLYLDQSPLVEDEANLVADNLFAFNDAGLAILPGTKGNTVVGNAFVDNLQQVSLRGAGQLLGIAWSRDGRGNYWSDYAGYGLAGAAVGRDPYRAESLFEALSDRRPALRFFLFTPASQALELAARAFPVFKPKAVLADPYPLLAPPALAPPLDSDPWRLAALWTPVALFSLSGLSAALFGRRRGPAPPTPGGAGRCAAAPKAAVLASGLAKSFGARRVLADLAFSLPAGESLVLWGPNGAGKSTLIKCLLGLHPFEGELSVMGHEVRGDGPGARSHIGYVPQISSAHDWSVDEAMEFVCRVRGADPRVIPERLAGCGLAGEGRTPVAALSGGMRQKLALAQALLADPDLLVLDEPCANLDLRSRREFMGLLRALKGARTMLTTSHRLDEVEVLADRVLWLEPGGPARALSPQQFFALYASACPLWIELEDPAQAPGALRALADAGWGGEAEGRGLWVQAPPGKSMEAVRALERSGFLVRDLRREAA